MRKAIVIALALAALSTASEARSVYKIGVVCKFDIDQYCKPISKKRLRDLKECLAKQEKNLLPQCQDHYKEAS